MTYRLHHLHLICSNLEQMITFFTEVLGAGLVERKKFGTADGATLDLKGTIINLRVAREDEKFSDGSSVPNYGYHHIGLTVEDIEKSYRELSAKGYVFSLPPKEAGDNRIAFFNGPDDITIELLQPIG